MKVTRVTKAVSRIAALLALGAAAGGAHASIYQFYSGSTLYATMTTGGTTNFSFAVASGINSAAYIDYLRLFQTGTSGSAFTNTTSTSTVSFVTGAYGLVTDQNSQYNWTIGFPNANGGPNGNRLTAGETATWTITPSVANSWDFNLLHVNAFDGVNSIKLSSCEAATGATSCSPPLTNIPEPGSLALVGLGLLAVGAVRRKLAPKVA